jgi:hypothetical protein
MVLVLDLGIITDIILAVSVGTLLSVLVICLWGWWERQVGRLRPWQRWLEGMPWPKKVAFFLGFIVVYLAVTIALMWVVWGQR